MKNENAISRISWRLPVADSAAATASFPDVAPGGGGGSTGLETMQAAIVAFRQAR
jgi:hypothetical protein